MPSALSGTQKTNITAVETAIGTAIASLSQGNEPWQRAALETLGQMRKLLNQIKVERSQ